MNLSLSQGSAEFEARSFDSGEYTCAQDTVDPSMPCESGFSPTQKIKVGESRREVSPVVVDTFASRLAPKGTAGMRSADCYPRGLLIG